jgi:hypothetical protein
VHFARKINFKYETFASRPSQNFHSAKNSIAQVCDNGFIKWDVSLDRGGQAPRSLTILSTKEIHHE